MIKTTAKMMGFLITVLLVFSAPVIYADEGGGFEWGHGHHMKGRFFHQLNLTDDQKKQLKDIWQKQRETMKASFEQLKANREALNKELLVPTLDMNKINDLQSQLKTLQAQMVDARLNSTLEVKKILTPEQFGKYLEFQKMKMRRFTGRFHSEEMERDDVGWHKYCDFRGHCRHHHRHHQGYRGDQRDGGYGKYHKHWGDNGDQYNND